MIPGVCFLLKEAACVCVFVFVCVRVCVQRNVSLLIGYKMFAACFPQVPHIEGTRPKEKDAVGDSAFAWPEIANNLNVLL